MALLKFSENMPPWDNPNDPRNRNADAMNDIATLFILNSFHELYNSVLFLSFNDLLPEPSPDAYQSEQAGTEEPHGARGWGPPLVPQ